MYGFVKVCAATPEIRVADVQFNKNSIIGCIAASQGAQVIVFPELSLSGYTCGDLFNQSALIEGVESALVDICRATAGNRALIFVGAPVKNGDRLYNCAVAVSDGKILGVVPKTNLPNYGEFYERRHFTSAPSVNGTVKLCGETADFGTDIIFRAAEDSRVCVAAEICEDLWVPDSPSVRHAKAGATIIVNLSCSDETAGKAEYRRSLVRMQSSKLVCAYVYADAGEGESTTDMAFAGHDIICEGGKLVAESNLFENCTIAADIDVEKLSNERTRLAGTFFERANAAAYKFVTFSLAVGGEVTRKFSKTPFIPADDGRLRERTELILSIQSAGLKKRLEHTKARAAVIGVSGGLDSALALLVIARAFSQLKRPMSDIIAVTMPGFGTTGKTFGNALKLIDCIGATSKTVDITQSVLTHFKDIGHDSNVTDVTYENAQARMRTLILMDIANETGGLVIGTGDLSELALGWATYNGDHMSMYGVNCSVPKTLVKHLVAYEAKRAGGDICRVLEDILNTEISPELLPPDKSGNIAQKTEDLVGPYILHDFFLYYVVRCGFAPDKVRYLACRAFEDLFDEAVIDKWLKNFYRRFFSQQFKRSCVPDGVKVGSVSLSPRGDWRMPSDACPSLWLDMLDD